MYQKTLKSLYDEQGFISAIPVLNETETLYHRLKLEEAESDYGNLHYKFKIHTAMTSAYELATHPNMLDMVEAILGPDILLYSACYIIKEANSPSHVSWHQDLTYWGLSHDDQVSAWLALSPATEESGCMRMIPGSHKNGAVEHHLKQDHHNVLLNGQHIRTIDESQAITCPLQPGEASFHHGWTQHASSPNHSQERRIGLNIQYLAPHVKQLKNPEDGAILVRGKDRHHHFPTDIPAFRDNDPEAWTYRQQLSDRIQAIQSTN